MHSCHGTRMNALNSNDHKAVRRFAQTPCSDDVQVTITSFFNQQRSSIISPLAVRNVMVDPLDNNEIPASMCNLSGENMGSGCLLGERSRKAWSPIALNNVKM